MITSLGFRNLWLVTKAKGSCRRATRWSTFESRRSRIVQFKFKTVGQQGSFEGKKLPTRENQWKKREKTDDFHSKSPPPPTHKMNELWRNRFEGNGARDELLPLTSPNNEIEWMNISPPEIELRRRSMGGANCSLWNRRPLGPFFSSVVCVFHRLLDLAAHSLPI